MQRRIADGVNGDNHWARRLRDQSIADDINAKRIREMIFQRDAKLEIAGAHAGKETETESEAESETKKKSA